MDSAVQKNLTPADAWLTAAGASFNYQDQSRTLVHQWRFLDVRDGEIVELQTLKPDLVNPKNEVDKHPKNRFAFVSHLAGVHDLGCRRRGLPEAWDVPDPKPPLRPASRGDARVRG